MSSAANETSASSETRGSVVVPAVNAPHVTTVLRSLSQRGVHTIAVSEHSSPPAFWSRYCDETASVPSPAADAEGYRDALLALARREDVHAVVPMREADIYTLAWNRDAFAEHVGTPWPSTESLTTVHDRERLFARADRAGVTVPETRLLGDVESWERERIVKGRFALLGGEYDPAFADGSLSMPETTRFLEPCERPDVADLVDAMGHEPIAQAYVEGTEYCLRAIYAHGEPVATSQKRLRRGYKYSRGPSIYHEAADVPELEAAGKAVLDELDWHGVASVGFIRDGDGEFNLLEVNPRFPASIPVDVHAGVDHPWYYWQLATAGEVAATPAYRPGRASHLLRGELVHLHSVLTERNPVVDRPSVPGTVADIAASLVRHPTFDRFSVDDPLPFLVEGLNLGRDGLAQAATSLRGD